MAKNEVIEQAIDDLKSQKAPNLDATTKKWDIVEPILRRRYKGETISHAEAQYRLIMLLTNTQEGVLIEYINKFSACNIHPTPQIIKNLVREMTGHLIKKRWMEHFQKRHKNKLRSRYMRNIN